MTTLDTNTPRAFETGEQNDLPVIAADIIYEGAAVGDNGSGFARPLQAADPFLGFALAKSDNSAGAAGAETVHLQSKGKIELAIGSLVQGDLGAAVYASDDNTFTKTSTSNSFIGRVTRFVSAGVGIVTFDAGVINS